MVHRMGQSGLPLSSVAPMARDEIDELLDGVAAFTHRLFHRVATAFMDASDDPAHTPCTGRSKCWCMTWPAHRR